ncbi:MAG: tetratricopeptide repeat protein, partial [Phycisphaerae bacterium]|nr:tetratricopeptide repeat protein [Phycisphaerae bacterium]
MAPDHPGTLLELGAALYDIDAFDDALAVLRQAERLKPDDPMVHSQLGAVLSAQDQLAAALAEYRQALVLDPASAQVKSNLAVALRDSGDLAGAMALLQEVIAMGSDYAPAHNNLGTIHSELGRFNAAEVCFRRAIELSGDVPQHHANLGMALLRRGQWQEGWLEYEWRLTLKQSESRSFNQPRWEGDDLCGRRILIYWEQGFGDAIQFLRYVPMVIARGGRVVLEMPPELLRLVQGTFEVERLVRRGDDPGEFDVCSPLMSLPGLFRTNLADIPADVPY